MPFLGQKIKNMLKRISEMMQNKYGKWSNVRFVFLLWGLLLIGVWGYVAITTKALPEIPEGVRWLTAVLMAGRVGYKWVEDNSKEVDKTT